MTEYYNVTTNIGDAEIANAIATNTKLNITHIAFGDGNGSVPTPSKSRTSLVHEVHRQAVTKYERHKTNANWIVIETVIPSNVGGFTIREMGVIANGKLISHGSHAPFEKVADPTGVSEYHLRFTQNINDGSVISITLDESLIFATQLWVEENFIKRSEIVDNLTTNDSTKPVSAKQAKILHDGKLAKTENAASATKLQTARTIALSGGVTGTATSFDGSGNISIPVTAIDGSKITTGTIPAARIPTLNQSTTGNASTATKLQTARKINGVSFDGSSDITVADSTKLPLSGGTLTGRLTIDTPTLTTQDNQLLVKAAIGRQAQVKVENHLRGGFMQVSGAGRYGLWDATNDKWLLYSDLDGGSGSCNVNAVSATKLQTARTIALSGGVTGTATSFDGSGDISIPVTAIDGSKITTGTIPAARIPTLNQSTTGNASTATKLQTARTIALSGGVTGTATSFDGSGNISIPVTAIDGSKITTGTIPAARIPTLNQNTTGTAAYAYSVRYESLPAGIDLNTITTPGFYYAPADAINSYESVLGWMEVRASNNWLLQEVHTVRTSASKKYFRIFNGSSWSDWQIVYTSNNPQTDISGNAATATKLKTARTIGGVSFDGSANINLPGVNTTGNQSTTGNASTSTKLQTARTIALSGGVTGTATSFDGSGNISIPVTAIDGSKITTGTIPAARIPTLNQSTTGNASTATKLQTARKINGVSFDGSSDITVADSTKLPLSGGDLTGNLTISSGAMIVNLGAANTNSIRTRGIQGIKTDNSAADGLYLNSEGGSVFFGTSQSSINDNGDFSGNAATATKLATARTIGGVSFDGSANINLPGVNTTGNQSTTGNASTATKLQTARTIALSGAVTGSGSFDGSGNLSIATTLQNFASSKKASGYKYLGDGLIIQWGTASSDAYNGTVTMPISFPNATLFGMVSETKSDTSGSIFNFAWIRDTTTASVIGWQSTGNPGYFSWFAIGY